MARNVKSKKFMGEIFKKYPKVKSIRWDQYTCLDGYFYIEPWSLEINGKSILKRGMNEEEHKAAWELERLIKLAIGAEEDDGFLDLEAPTAINTGNLLRALLGDNVTITLNRNGSIERKPSWSRRCEEDMAEMEAEEEAQEQALQGHVRNCEQCTAAVDDNKEEAHVDKMCEAGQNLTQPFELGGCTNSEVWDRLQPPTTETKEEERLFEEAQKRIGKEVLAVTRALAATA